jgi:hypothetical protein
MMRSRAPSLTPYTHVEAEWHKDQGLSLSGPEGRGGAIVALEGRADDLYDPGVSTYHVAGGLVGPG